MTEKGLTMTRAVPVVCAIVLACAPARAQVLTTADTLGKGTQGVLASDSHIFVDEARLHIIAGQYVRGLAGRADLYVVASDTRTEDEAGTSVLDQFSMGVGGNWNLARWNGFSVSLFGIVSVPLTRRDQASDVLANPALVVSRTVVKDRLALYGGINALVPIGHRSRGWFTPPDTKVNAPVGALIMLGRWGVFAEVDIGPLTAVGVGLSRTF
jgi:hypothetical protein